AGSRGPLSGAGQGQPDRRAGAGLRLELDLAAQGAHRLGDDGEAEPEATSVAALAAVEAVEDPLLLGCRNAAPGVLDLDRDGARWMGARTRPRSLGESFAPACKTWTAPEIVVSGVRSSCAALVTNSRSARSRCSRSEMSVMTTIAVSDSGVAGMPTRLYVRSA